MFIGDFTAQFHITDSIPYRQQTVMDMLPATSLVSLVANDLLKLPLMSQEIVLIYFSPIFLGFLMSVLVHQLILLITVL